MRNKFSVVLFSLFLIMNAFVPSALAIADDSMPIDSTITLKSTTKDLSAESTELSIDLTYSPANLEKETVNKDFLKLTIPKGMSFKPELNQNVNDAVEEDTTNGALYVDMQKIEQQATIVFSLDMAELSTVLDICGTHIINDETIGRVNELDFNNISKVEEVVSSDSATKESISETEKMESSNEAEQSQTTTTSKPSIMYKSFKKDESLVLGDSTSRSLPIADIADGQYNNVTYFDVNSKESWQAALATDNNNKSEITYINITGDFSFSSETKGTASYMKEDQLQTKIANKKLVINGNNHTIDFRGQTHWLDNVDWDVIIQNLSYYNSNDWGIFEGYSSGKSPTVTFFNVHQTGAQVFEGSRGKVILGGDSSFHSSDTESYVSPIDHQTVELDTRYTFGSSKGSSNFGASEIYIKAESNLSVNNGRLGSNFTIFPKGNFYVEDGTNTKITLENTDMGSMGDKWGIADYCPAAISIVSDIPGTVNTWTDALRPATLKNRNNSVYLGENAALKINNGAAREAYASAIEIQNSGGSIELAKNAELFINIEKDSEEDKAGQTPVAFDKESASFILGENAKFDLCIGSQQVGNQSSGTAIKFDGKDSNIQLSKASSFTVKSNSDYDQGILNFSGVNSKINVDNEAIFDLEYLKNSSQPLLRMSEGLVSIPATGNYKHTIKEWSANNFDESSPDMMAQPLNKTSFKVKNTTFSDVTTTADQSIEKLFIDNFTNAAQKMVIEPLNYSVSLDPISNETKSKYVVTGDAIPSNGSIELTGGGFDLLPKSERTVSVNDDGSFKWEGALTTPFNAGDKIVATYVGSKNSGETIVVDKTKPSGKTKVYDIDEGEKIPAAIDFIESVEDTNPTDSTINDFTYSFIDKVILPDDVAKISNGKDEQDYIGHIKITDKAGNDSKDIEVKMIVHKVQNGGNENNGTGSTKDLRLDYVPSEFNFGTVTTSATSTIKNANSLNGDNRQWIQISDDRSNEEGWKVKASISDFSSTSSTDTLKGAEIVIPDGNSFNKKTANQTNPKGLSTPGEVLLSKDKGAQTILSGSGENSKSESKYVWNKNSVQIKIPGGQGKTNESYQADVTWVVESSVTN